MSWASKGSNVSTAKIIARAKPELSVIATRKSLRCVKFSVHYTLEEWWTCQSHPSGTSCALSFLNVVLQKLLGCLVRFGGLLLVE